VVAVDAAEPGRGVVLALSPGAEPPQAEAGRDGGLQVRFTVPASGPATVFVAAGPLDGRSPLAVAPHLEGHVRMAANPPRDGLVVRTGLDEVDAAPLWARRRLVAASLRPGGADRPWALFWSGLGALASGDDEAAGRFLVQLEKAVGEQPGDTPTPSDHPLALPAAPLPLLLATQHRLVLGDTGPVQRLAARLDVEGLEASPGDWPSRALWSRALDSLADALRFAAPDDVTARYRRLAAGLGEAAAGGPPRSAGVRLPMAGEARSGPGGAAGALAWLLGDEGGAPPGTVPEVLAAWATFRRGDSLEGYTLWRTAVAQGLENGPEGRGSWDPWTEAREAPVSGVLLATLARGLLGWAPDAPVGRVRLAPRLPGHLTRFAVEGLRVGDSAFRLRYGKEEGVRRFALEPTAGAAPATVVLEPVLDLATVDGVRLEGEEVELEVRDTPGGLVVPIQLPLEGPRTLEITGTEHPQGYSSSSR
jgi:hypothetical protein